MAKKIITLSLGGSLIIPKKINTEFLEEFKKTILKNSKKYKFIIVCGGGISARTYIEGLEKQKIKSKEYFQSLIGISITRLNARFMSYFFQQDPDGIPHTLKQIEKLIKKQQIVFCGGLEYQPKQTSDTTAAKIANHFKTHFINLTNVQGLHTKNPKKFSFR